MRHPSDEIPSNQELTTPVYNAIVQLGGSATNKEIAAHVEKMLNISPEALELPHLGSTTTTELEYRIGWAKTILKKQGLIINSARSVWSLTATAPEDVNEEAMDAGEEGTDIQVEGCEPWRDELSSILHSMDPYVFERLIQRLLRECGFESVTVTKKSGDGGIDGYGKLRVNGIFCFNVAFQCKRYKNLVPVSDIRDFRGSLPRSIEKGVFITTGRFTQGAIDEASDSGKQQIDLMDGDELIEKMRELGLGVREVTDYRIDHEFFRTLEQ